MVLKIVNLKKCQWCGFGCFQYLATLTAMLSMVSSGMHYSWPTPSLPKLLSNDSHIRISNDQGSWLAVVPLLSSLLGSAIACLTVDSIGRKLAVQLSNVPFGIAWILIAVSKSVTVLYIARFTCGLADGYICTVIPIYIGEIAHPKLRGFLGSSITVTWLLGLLLINVIGSYFSISITASVSGSIPLITLIVFSWMPESPYYLLMKLKYNSARKNLQILRGVDDVQEEFDRINEAVQIQMTNRGKFSDLFTSKSNRKALGIVIILRGTQQLCGTSAITFYLKHIFNESGSSITSETSILIYFSIQLIVTTISSAVVDNTGRKPLLLISSIGSVIPLFTEGVYFFMKQNSKWNVEKYSIIPLLGLVIFIIFFSIGLHSIPFLVIGEIFPVNTKAFALFVADIIYGIIAAFASKFFQLTKDYGGIYVPFFGFAIFSLIGVVVITIAVPETKGKSLEDIQNDLGNRNNLKESN